MLKKKLLITLLFVSSLLFAQGNKVYSITEYSWMYDDLDKLMLESRISPLSTAYPYTGNEIEFILSKIPLSTLSKPGYAMYNKILSALGDLETQKGLDYDFGLEVNVETYLQTNKDNDDWIYDYYDRQALIELDFELGINDFFWAGLTIPLQKGLDYSRYSEGAESNISLLWNMNQIDAQFPFFALSSIGGDNWSILFGRDLLNYGVGESGSFTLSDDASYHDFFKASTFWDKFKYTLTLVNIEPIDLDDLTGYDNDTDDDASDDLNELKIFIDHSFEFRPINNLSFAIHEVTIRGGSEVYFGYLNPFMIMHNLALTDRHDTIYGNSVLTFSSIYTPFKNFNIYGEFCLDQYETASEASRNSDDYDGDPNAFGFLAGLKYQMNLDDFSILFNGEYAYTNPYLYRSTNSWSVYALTRYYHSVYNDSNDIEVESLGYEYGPDVTLIKLSGDATFLDGDLSIYLEYLNILQGEYDVEDNSDNDSITDVIFKSNIFTLNAEYKITNWASVYGQINALFYQNVDNVEGDDLTDFQFVFGSNLKFF